MPSQVSIARLSGASEGAVDEELKALDGGQPWTEQMVRMAEMSSGRDPAKSISQRRRFWETARAIAPSVSTAALKLLSMHCSTASTERNWSIFSAIYRNTLRNRMKVRSRQLKSRCAACALQLQILVCSFLALHGRKRTAVCVRAYMRMRSHLRVPTCVCSC
mgnify:CR=1 FL=1